MSRETSNVSAQPPGPKPAGLVCPLSRVKAGTPVRIKQLLAAPDVCQRLRELGLCEEQRIRLVLCNRNIVCQVCNVRLGISAELADSIVVEPLACQPAAA